MTGILVILIALGLLIFLA